MEATYRVIGMTCGGCEASVKRALTNLDPKAALEVTVSLKDATATVRGAFQDEDIRRAIEDAGYDYGGRVETSG